jgi:hypothetical protein
MAERTKVEDLKAMREAWLAVAASAEHPKSRRLAQLFAGLMRQRIDDIYNANRIAA